MNKRLGFFVVFFVICLCSCSKSEANDGYMSIESTYTDNNEALNQFIDIKYPQILGLDDGNVKQYINDQIEVAALKVLSEFTTLAEMNISVTYSLDNLSPDFLSLHFIRVSMHSAQAYPLIRIIAVNFEVASGRIITLNDVIEIDDSFVQSFFRNFQLQGNYESLSTENEINKYVSDIISIEKFKTCGENLDSEYQYYFSDSSLFISIAVPHSIGSYVLYEAKYSEIKDILKLNIYE